MGIRRTTDPMASASSSTGMTTSGTAAEPTEPSAPVRTASIPALVVLGPAVALVVAAHVVGRSAAVPELSLGAEPFIGSYDVRVVGGTWLAASVAVVAVALAPLAVERLRWRALLAVGWATSALQALVLAAVDGRDRVWEPLATGFEYRAVLDDIDRQGVGAFVADFVGRLPEYPTHVRGHPVGAPLVFWVQERLGLAGPEWSAALVLAVGTSVVVTVAVVVRVVAGEDLARRAVPFLAIGPSLVWVATSADALFAGVVAAAVALVVLGAQRHDGLGDAQALVGGAVGAVALHLSYGSTLMLLPALVVVVVERRVRPVVWASVGAAAVTAGFVAAGFWWFDGLAATREEYFLGAGGVRPFWYFATLGNPAAFAVALGPAVVVALARLRDRRLWTVAGGALAGVVLADLSGMSKAEVERIWLPFVPFLAVAAASLPRPPWPWWLAAQAGLAVVVQTVLESPW